MRNEIPILPRTLLPKSIGFILLLIVASVSLAEPPYPPSHIIKDIIWHWDTHESAAPGSDQWPVTWADDNHLYACWGDGGGFDGTNSDGRVKMGVARIEGIPPNWKGYNVWGGKDPESSQPAQEGKARPICVDGVLYLYAIKEDSWDKGRIFRSTNHGMTWTWTDYDWEYLFKNSTFLQYGKDYRGARDNYVYIYFLVEKKKHYGLARVPKDQIMKRTEYEVFAGLNARQKPRWSKDTKEYKVAFDAPDGAGWGHQVMYHPILNRYLFTKFHDKAGGWGIFDAPEPWGPWTTVAYYDSGQWIDDKWKFCFSFNQKWMSADGKTMWMIFSGWPEYDAYHQIKCTLTLKK